MHNERTLRARVARVAAISLFASTTILSSAAAQPTACSKLMASIPVCLNQATSCSTMKNATDQANCVLLANQSYQQCLTSKQNIQRAYGSCAAQAKASSR